MSVASSTASTMKVAYDGKVITMEQSLDENFRGIQGLLNELHVQMRADCALMDQEIDEDDDFKEHVLHEDSANDIIANMVRLLSYFPPMMDMTRGSTPAGCREWYKAHKATRKEHIAKDKANHVADAARAKAELKQLLSSESKSPE